MSFWDFLGDVWKNLGLTDENLNNSIYGGRQTTPSGIGNKGMATNPTADYKNRQMQGKPIVRQTAANTPKTRTLNPTPGLIDNWQFQPDYNGIKLGMPAPSNPFIMPEIAMPDTSEIDSDIKRLLATLRGGFVDDGSYRDPVSEAFSGAYGALNNARDTTRGNFKESSAALTDLYAGHRNQIDTVDREAYQENNQNLAGTLDGMYNGAIDALKADRTARFDERTEMLNRLGLQSAGLGNTGTVQDEAIANLTQQSAGAQDQAAQYGAANLDRNIARGQSVAAEGVDRQTNLRRQLDQILGGLDNREAELKTQESQAMLDARNNAYNQWLQSQALNSGTLDRLMGEKARIEDRYIDQSNQQQQFQWEQALAQQQAQQKNAAANAPTPSAFDAIGQVFQSQGLNPVQFQNAYSQAVMEGGYTTAAGESREDQIARKMKALDPTLSDAAIIQYIHSLMNYGTAKPNTGSPGVGMGYQFN